MSKTKTFHGLNTGELLKINDPEFERLFFPYLEYAKLFTLIAAIIIPLDFCFNNHFSIFLLTIIPLPIVFAYALRTCVPFLLSPARDKLSICYEGKKISDVYSYWRGIKVFWWLPSWIIVLPAQKHIIIMLYRDGLDAPYPSYTLDDFVKRNPLNVCQEVYPFVLMTKENAAEFLEFITKFNNVKLESSDFVPDKASNANAFIKALEDYEKIPLIKKGGIIRIDS